MTKKIKAMVMAAGMGSRLEPITLRFPKPLIPVMNRPLMDIILTQLHNVGVNEVISNTYYLADQIIDRYKNNKLGVKFSSIKETELSGTAGGVKKCQFFFDEGEDFVVMSGDILTTADIKKGIEIHKQSGAIATIGVKQVPHEQVCHFGVVVTDQNGYITEFQEKPSVDEAKSNLINTGIYIFNYKIFDYIPENTFYDFAKNVFPKLLEEGQINTFEVCEYWNDIGTIGQYKQSIQDVFNGVCRIKHDNVVETNLGNYVAGDSKIPSTVRFVGNSVIGSGVKLGEYIKLENCVVMDGAEVKTGSELSNCVILPALSTAARTTASKSSSKDVLMV
ncbi:MAG: sugar phosphate nucleotidyltransferase [Muribaculaceae bacterium]|nr:sugar phosphate nucleotidyltransferase [Muribaculaceae bacterium]